MFKIFKKLSIKYGFSTRQDKNMRVLHAKSRQNRASYLKKCKVNQGKTVSTLLAHNSRVVVVGKENLGQVIKNTDGLVAKDKEVYLTITGADCFPVYAYEPTANVIGLAHIGWRSAQKNIASELISQLQTIGADPKQILIGIGPGLMPCHFEVQQDLADFFEQYENIVKNKKGHKFLNLPELITQQLLEAGVEKENIECSGECTYCLKDKYFSYRRDKPEDIEAMVAYIGLIA